jgi:hypothetical protein
MFVAEARIIPVLDDWLGALSLKTVDQAITEMLVQAGAEKPEPTDITRARKIALVRGASNGAVAHGRKWVWACPPTPSFPWPF